MRIPFKPGESGNPKGRPKGSPNKLTKTFKEMIKGELERLGPKHLHKWASRNPGAFYHIASKLIPTELSASMAITPAQKTYEEIEADFTQQHGVHGGRILRLINQQISPEEFAKEVLKPYLEPTKPDNVKALN